MASAVFGQLTVQCVNCGQCSVWTVNSSVCEQSGQCSAGRDYLSKAACKANLISTKVAAQDRRVQEDSL